MQADLLERASWAGFAPFGTYRHDHLAADCSPPREHVIEIALILSLATGKLARIFHRRGSLGIAALNDIFRPLQHKRASARSPSSIGV